MIQRSLRDSSILLCYSLSGRRLKNNDDRFMFVVVWESGEQDGNVLTAYLRSKTEQAGELVWME